MMSCLGSKNGMNAKVNHFEPMGRVFLKNHQPNSKSTTSSDDYRRKKEGFRSHTFQESFQRIPTDDRQVEELEPMTPSRPAGVKLDIPCERSNVS